MGARACGLGTGAVAALGLERPASRAPVGEADLRLFEGAVQPTRGVPVKAPVYSPIRAARGNGTARQNWGRVGVAAEAHESQKLERLCRPTSDASRAPGDQPEAAIDLTPGQGALPAQDAGQERHHARPVRAHRVQRQTRRPRSATARAPHPVPRRLCAERELARTAHASGARQTAVVERSRGPTAQTCRHPHAGRAPPLDDLGATPQARVRHRRKHLHPLRRRDAHRRQRRTTRSDPRPPRPLRKARPAAAA